MKITFIAPTPPDVAAFGVRQLSSFLKQHGMDVTIIFLPGGVEKYKQQEGNTYHYQREIVDQVIELCRGSGLLGVSFMSNYLDRAEQLCRALTSSLDIPLIVGGIHPTVQPEPCCEFADIVCRGEGEGALLDLIQRLEAGEDYADIPNLCLKRDGKLIMNPLRPLIQDLDSLPFFDFDLENHYIFDNQKNSVEPMSHDLLQRCFPLEPHVEGSFSDSYERARNYKTMTTRGCPHHCTFCAENTLARMYSGQGYLRKRGIQHIIDELLLIKEKLPFVESIFLFDDTFLVRTTEEIEAFCRAYKKHIDLPFHIQASPGTVNQRKMDTLVEAGLVFVEMGIQSISERGKELYRRTVSDQKILEGAEIFNEYKDRINPPCYHVILDNPWESSNDVLETLDLVLRLPRPFWLKRSSLVLFPGTELYNKAKKEGWLSTKEDERREIYAKHLHMPKGRYVNFLMYLAGFSYFPRGIVRLLAGKTVVRFFDWLGWDNLFLFFYTTGERFIILWKGIKSLFTGDFARIKKYFYRVT